MGNEPLNKDQIFNLVAEIHDPEQQRKLLDELCGNDFRLRAQIEKLLSIDGKLGDFLEPDVREQTGLPEETVSGKPDATLVEKIIGSYQIKEVIGRGGMGAVYLARQSQPIKRDVALKVIRGGLDSRQVLARFAAERQALALMDHPNIARIVDVGTHDGQPWFAMELVEGPPITRFCDENRLSIEDRLKLFVDVCRGVQHAHQKGIIHRDLKPSNILVANVDGRPVPKVIDFGLAKALESAQRLTDESLHTQIGQIVGTLKYMSPEQATLDLVDIDTRTDIYSLGVVLYELLTGSTPLDDDTLSQKSVLEVLELIREEEPVKPSRRLSSAGDRATEITQQRRTDSGSLNRILIGDLDWVVTKALEKDRSRRYETAAALANDLRRFLDNEPVKARPPSTGYRVNKFVRKNQGLVAAAATITVLLIAATAVSSWFAYEASVAKQDAEQKAEQSRIDKLAAEKSAKRSRDALQILTDSFRSIDPLLGADAGMLARDVLSRARQSLDLSDLDREGEATMLSALSASFVGVGDFDAALAAAEESLQITEQIKGPEDPQTLSAMGQLAQCYLHSGKLDDAVSLNEKLVREMKIKMGPEHPLTLNFMATLAQGYLAKGRTNDAIALEEKTVELLKSKMGLEHPQTLTAMGNLAMSYGQAGQLDKELRLTERTVELMQSVFEPDHPRTLVGMSNLAMNHLTSGKNDEAIVLFNKAIPAMKDKLGAGHPRTLVTIAGLADGYSRSGQTRRAIKMLEEVVDQMKIKIGVDHPSTLSAIGNLASSYFRTGQPIRAIPLHQQVLEHRKDKLGVDHPHTLVSMNNLANSQFAARKYDEALRLFEAMLQLSKAKLGVNHPTTMTAMHNVARSYTVAGRMEESLELNEKTLQLMRENLGSDHLNTLASMHNTADCYRRAGRLDEAIELNEQLVELNKDKWGVNNPRTLVSMNNLADCYLAAGRTDEAIELFDETFELMKTNMGTDHRETRNTMNNLARSFRAAGRTDEALDLSAELFQLIKSQFGDRDPQTVAALGNLAGSFSDGGRTDEAFELFEQAMELMPSVLGEDEPQTILAKLKFGQLLIRRDPERAVELLTQVFEQRRSANPEAWTTYNAQSLLGEALLKQENFEKAKAYLTESFVGLQDTIDEIPEQVRSQRLHEAVDRLIKLATMADDQEAMNKWQKEKEQLPFAE